MDREKKESFHYWTMLSNIISMPYPINRDIECNGDPGSFFGYPIEKTRIAGLTSDKLPACPQQISALLLQLTSFSATSHSGLLLARHLSINITINPSITSISLLAPFLLLLAATKLLGRCSRLLHLRHVLSRLSLSAAEDDQEDGS
ncbi:hypothetical protein CRG98_031346 [Punica granatum]|uniref:Uncharacterized protein n=1 Tax=Punica granatum TaxID=22663 RepID=A0A2I0IWY1_PUNGR|nr:hypothetical protein CRG98_031346 [Punica granatum]